MVFHNDACPVELARNSAFLPWGSSHRVVVQAIIKRFLLIFIFFYRNMSEQNRSGNFSRFGSRYSPSVNSRGDEVYKSHEQQLHEERDHTHRVLARLSTAIRADPINKFNEVVVKMKQSEIDGLWARFQEISSDLLVILDPNSFKS